MLTQRKKFSEAEKKKLASNMRALEREKKQQESGMFQVVPLSPTDPTLPPAIICDIDGTLAKRCDRHWMDFDKSIDDELDFRTKFILELISEQNKWQNPVVPNTTIFLITGRDERFAEVTNKWLNKHGVVYDHMFMRRVGDKRASYIVKEEIWAANIRDKYNVFFVIDDREQDIKMYRSRGMYVYTADNTRENLVLDKQE